MRLTTETFLEKAVNVWGDRWDYTDTAYVNSTTKISVRCREHDVVFLTLPNNHLRSVGCAKCNGSKTVTTESYIAEAIGVWGDRWDYSNSVYVNNHTKMTIICKLHGEFKQHPRSHLKGFVGCNRCSVWSGDTAIFADAGSMVWGCFDYSKSEYKSARDKITIICPTHGEFEQVADSHLRGFNGCRGCDQWGTSNLEKDVLDYVMSLGVDVITNDRSVLGVEIDIYIPDAGVAIEVNGVYYHSSKFKDKNFHSSKTRIARDSGIRLLHIWEDDWNLRQDIVKSHISSAIGKSSQNKVSARNTVITNISHADASVFLDKYHIQGSAKSSFALALNISEEVIAVALFRKLGDDLHLVRYASKDNVRGGCSKLVKYVESNYKYNNLVTFADLTFSYGALYERTGWIYDGFVKPDYCYLVNGCRVHKANFRKSRFKKDHSLVFHEGMSESQLAQANNLLRVYDSGKLRYVKPKPILGR